MSAHLQVTKYADFIGAIREVAGLQKALPDVVDTQDVIAACRRCQIVRTGIGVCANHRRLVREGVL